MVPGKLPVSKCPTDLDNSRQGLNELAVGVGGGCLGIFSLAYLFSFLSPSLWETAQYKTEILSKWVIKPNLTNQPTTMENSFLNSFQNVIYS